MNRKLIYENQFNNAYNKLLVEYETSILPKRKKSEDIEPIGTMYVGPKKEDDSRFMDPSLMNANIESQDVDKDDKESSDKNTSFGLKDIGHFALDVAGLIPGVGEFADLANAAWYAAEGDMENATISAAAAIPFAGWAATGAKAVKHGAKVADAARGVRSATRGVESGVDAARNIKRVENLSPTARVPKSSAPSAPSGETIKITIGGKPVDVKLNTPAKRVTRVPSTTTPGTSNLPVPSTTTPGTSNLPVPVPRNLPVPVPRNSPVPVPRNSYRRDMPQRSSTKPTTSSNEFISAPINSPDGETVDTDIKNLGIITSKVDISNYMKSLGLKRDGGEEHDQTHGVAKRFLPNPQLWVSDLIRDKRGRESQYD